MSFFDSVMRRFSKRNEEKLVIPEGVLKQIESVQEMTVIFKDDVADDRYWNFGSAVDAYVHEKILWKITEEVPELTPIAKEQVEMKEHVLTQRILWGQSDDAYFYGTMSFVKFGKLWVYIGKDNYRITLARLPTFEESYARYTNKDGSHMDSSFEKMIETFYCYSVE